MEKFAVDCGIRP